MTSQTAPSWEGLIRGFMGEHPYRGLRPISGALTLKENGRSLTKMNERPVNDTNRRSAGSVQPAHMVSVGVTERPIWKRPRTSTNPKAPGKTPVSGSERHQQTQRRLGATGWSASASLKDLQPRPRRPGPAAPPLHPARQVRNRRQAPCTGRGLFIRGRQRGRSLMQPTHSLTVISLGGGVQSSVMALMASQGAFDAIPDCAIFADNGRSLREDVKTLTNHSGNHSFVDLPLYLKGRNGHGDGIGRRQCTEHYKIRRAPRSAWVERFGFGTRPGVGRWLGVCPRNNVLSDMRH